MPNEELDWKVWVYSQGLMQFRNLENARYYAKTYSELYKTVCIIWDKEETWSELWRDGQVEQD